MQRPGAGDHGAGAIPVAARGPDRPRPVPVVPLHRLDPAAVADMVVDPVLGGAAAQVLPDLLLRREQPAPRGVQLIRERVERRRDVACTARIPVIAPRPAEVGGLLQDHEVVETGLPQRYAHPDAAEPGPDNDDLVPSGHVRAPPACRHAPPRHPPPGHALGLLVGNPSDSPDSNLACADWEAMAVPA